MARKDFHKVIIGRSDLVHFVDLDLVSLPAKVDTGAYHSSVHASDITLSADGKTLSFILLGGHPVFHNLAVKTEAKVFNEVEIKNSFGHMQKRYEVRLRVKIGPKIFWAYFSLADRSGMIYPILLGRKMLNKRFLVDSGESLVNRVELKRKYALEMPQDEEALEAQGESV